MAILVTGAAGFIGAHVCDALLARGETVVGLDLLNDYYDPAYKQARLTWLARHAAFRFIKQDCADRAGMAKGISALGEKHADSFETLALPVANRKKMGVIAMKIFAQEQLNGKAPVDKLINYSLSLPVSAVVLGMPKLEYIEQNITVAKAFKPMPAGDMRNLSDELAGAHKASIDRFFADHVDA